MTNSNIKIEMMDYEFLDSPKREVYKDEIKIEDKMSFMEEDEIISAKKP